MVTGLRVKREAVSMEENGRRFWVPAPWPFNGLFSLAGSQDVGNSSSTASESAAPTHEN